MASIVISVVFAIIVFCANVSSEDNLKNNNFDSVDVPLIDSLEAPLKAELDISKLTTQLEALISKKVRTEVKNAYVDLVDSLIENKTKQFEEKLKTEETVGFTALGTECGKRSKGTRLKFPNVKSSFGMSNISTFKESGIFTCEKTGLYLITIIITSGLSKYAAFGIYKGDRLLSKYYIGHSASTSDINSGTGTILQHLNASEIMYVKTIRSDMRVHGTWSSFTVLKVK